MVEQLKKIKLENWGTFFLQRLQVFFATTDYCDLTLQFEGNVQLKVHRLVINACTDYFKFLEKTGYTTEKNTIVMPNELQSDVIVPIVNFMYTGMLEFHISLSDRLYRAAQTMNISLLTKLLDAQKVSTKPIKQPPKQDKRPAQARHQPDISSLPGRKPQGWKRRAPAVVTTVARGGPGNPAHTESKWSDSSNNPPRPTRFEWPEDELPAMTMLDSNFEDISYTSRPLLTKEEEEKVKLNFDDLRNNVEIPTKKSSTKSPNNSLNFKDLEEFAKEQRIRSTMFEDPDEMTQKRKADQQGKPQSKKMKINQKDQKDHSQLLETTISVESSTAGSIDHTKIVTEILKKYPDIVKKNKNIKLKIMPGNKDANEKDRKIVRAVCEPVKRSSNNQPDAAQKHHQPPQPAPQQQYRKHPRPDRDEHEGPWTCTKCPQRAGGEAPEFVLYYLYRKHMTDVHDEVFDQRLCKYCGRRCPDQELMLYHMYIKHALKPPLGHNFPVCDKCPYIALNIDKLDKHRLTHNSNEIQCQDCKLAFDSTLHLSSHIRITGHYNKPGKAAYDCQYCMKKLQSGLDLMAHLRRTHANESKRDGIAGLDELDSMEDSIEYPHEMDISDIMLSDVLKKEKVNVISNVPVNSEVLEGDGENRGESEGIEGITGGLNLVDIVVLDDNRQYILPGMGGHAGQSFAGQVISAHAQDNTVIHQSMIQSSTGDIASTDELVMVLTDHDYPEEHEGQNPENSNIVVLYSHPVDGQEGQFITSQGNLMVNSQTGLLEIRNGPPISATSTANQILVANPGDSPIESIEMIQREIDNQTTGLKDESEPFYAAGAPAGGFKSMPDLTGGGGGSLELEEAPGGDALEMEASSSLMEAHPHIEISREDEHRDLGETATREDDVQNGEETMEVDEDDENKAGDGEESDAKQVVETTDEQSRGIDVAPPQSDTQCSEKLPEVVEEAQEIADLHEAQEIVEEVQEIAGDLDEAMEVDGKAEKEEDKREEIVSEEPEPSVGSDNQVAYETDQKEQEEERDGKEVESNVISRDSQAKDPADDINKTILDDWDDTDSQEGDKSAEAESRELPVEEKSKQVEAVQNVNKLMDDWEEEEDEENEEEEETKE
ncbi:unnamed protein product [Phyllotreta striolata]|uniref:Centrosome-associated zinc finger protein CP190 n=1 Tax=Phyllotreta striolata TaxID=444603 RepID=A0A9N9XQD6_PHYSR|nr:unnamed protein product [Phyllotreta striolata]